MNPLVSAEQDETARAMEVRAQWMREMGLSEEEIREYCRPEVNSVVLAEELASLEAVRRIEHR